MTAREKFVLRLCILVYSLAFVGSAALLSLLGDNIGLERGTGTWIWAGAMTLLAGLMFGPFIARHTGAGRALLMLGLILAAGVGVYAYVALVMVPPAIEAASGGRGGGKPGG